MKSTTESEGKTANEVFQAAVERAKYDHGHGGYTGTIAEKHKFVEIPLPRGGRPSLRRGTP